MKRVWIIEAPGKAEIFSKALSASGFGQDRLLATYGRLFDLPSNELGFDLDIVSNPKESPLIRWIPKRSGQIEKLKLLLKDAEEVVLATDSDLEGELISSQVVAICSQNLAINPPRFLRVYISSITADHIVAAYKDASTLDENKVRAAKAKRVLDRILGFCMHDPDAPWRMSMGRVISPLISSMHSNPPISTIIRHKLTSGWSVFVRLDANHADQANTIENILHSLKEPEITVSRSVQMTHENKPLTGPEAIKLCVRSLGRSPGDVQSSMQDAYEKGRLTYPRSDSRRLGAISRKWMARAAANAAITYDESLVEARQSEALEGSFDAHEAVMPTQDNWVSTSVSLNSMSLDQGVQRVLSEYCLRIGEPAETFTREYGDIHKSTANGSMWHKSLKPWWSNISIERDRDQYDYPQDPMRYEYSRPPTEARGPVQTWILSPEEIAFERLMHLGLGRPSTIQGLSQKSVRNYLSASGKVNGRGILMIKSVRNRIPLLLDHRVAIGMEKAVVELSKPLSIADRIGKAWTVLNGNLSGVTETEGRASNVISQAKDSVSKHSITDFSGF